MILSCNNVGLSFGVDVILKEISFHLNEGEKLAVVGVNGAGKTTLLKILAGQTEDYSGSVWIQSGARVGFLRQNFVLESDKSVLDEMLGVYADLMAMEDKLRALEERMSEGSVGALNEYERLRRDFEFRGGLEYRSRTLSTLSRMGFSGEMLSLRVNSLSGGQKTVLSMVKVLLENPDILILDEPTNHLDMNALLWLEQYIRKLKTTVIIVSHDRYFLDKTTTKTLEIENTRGTLYHCSYSSYREQKKKNREDAAKRYEDQQKEIRRIQEFIKLQHKWNRERNIIAAESREKALARMTKLERPDAEPKGIHFSFESAIASGNDVLSVKELSKAFGDRRLFSALSFEVKRDSRVFITGPNGCGKSTLLKILCSKLDPTSGSFTFGYNVRIGYYDQENQDLDPNNTVFEELWQFSDSMEKTRRLLSVFGFFGDDVFKNVKELSGGEKARLTLAKLMQQKVNLLILDEPTNHLDVLSREALENAVKDFDGTVIAVSHDRYFVASLATEIVDIGGNPLTGETVVFRGGYEDYLAYRQKVFPTEEQSSKSTAAPGAGKAEYEKNKMLRSLERSREKNLKKTEDRIAQVEERIGAIDEEMSTEAQSDYARLEVLVEEKTALEEELEALYVKWEELQS